jgi:hypothetical protein
VISIDIPSLKTFFRGFASACGLLRFYGGMRLAVITYSNGRATVSKWAHAACPYIKHVSVRKTSRRSCDHSIGAVPSWLSDLDGAAAIEGGLILTIGTSILSLARSNITGKPSPQRLPSEPGKWAIVCVVGALPTLQWMVRKSKQAWSRSA